MTKLRDNLLDARKSKKDEFFTQYETVEEELSKYKSIFNDKVVYLNCDNTRSSFFQYFQRNFDEFGLKKLIATCYNQNGCGYKYELCNYSNDIKRYELQGNGSFLSQECIDILKECDFVTTNPPFSLWRQYIELVTHYNKQFVVLGSLNCVSYKNVFSLFIDNKIRLGYGKQNQVYYFSVPPNYEIRTKFYEEKEGKTLLPVMNCCWFTNIFDLNNNDSLNIFKFTENSPKYSEERYFKYVNYNAINVDRIKDIPCDYYDIIGVPLTYLCVHNQNLFDIVGSNSYNIEQIKEYPLHFEQNGAVVDTKKLGNALFVKLKEHERTKKQYWDDNGTYYKAPYARVFLKRK